MKLFGLIVAVLAVGLVFSCKKDEPPPAKEKTEEKGTAPEAQEEKKPLKERVDAKGKTPVATSGAAFDQYAESLRKFRPELLDKESSTEEGDKELAASQSKQLNRTDHLGEKKPVPEVEEPIVDTGSLITLGDISGLKNAKGAFEPKPLEGIPVSANYRSVHFKPKGRDEFGLSLQIWRSRNPFETRQKYQDLFSTYPNSKEIEPVSGSTFFAYLNEILYIGFSVPLKNYNVVISCSQKLCSSDEIYDLSKKVAKRFK